MDTQFRNFDAPSRPQVVTIEWERLTPDDQDASPLEWMDESDPDDAERILAWRDGDFSMIGVQAQATVIVPIGGGSFTVYEFTSPGLWAVESDSGEAYLNEIFENEKAELLEHVAKIGQAFATLATSAA
jgi:hypothetical protein